jgi:hypothetical protein
MGVEVGRFGALADWLERISARSSIAAELDLVATL